MATSIIDLAKQYLTSEVVHKVSSTLGENPEHLEKAIGASIPSILAGLLNTASSSGANRLFDMLKQEPPEVSHLGGLDGVFGNLGSLLGGGSLDSLLKYGQTILSAIFGGKLSSLLDLIAGNSGIKTSSASSLLGMLAPLVMGIVRKELGSRGMSPAGLLGLLSSQKDQITKLAPTGLSNVLGLSSLANLGSVADTVKAAGAGAAHEFGRTAAAAAKEGTNWANWAAPLALAAAAILGLLWYYSQPTEPAPNPEAAPPQVTVAPPVKPAADRVAQGTAKVAGAIKDAGRAITQEGKKLVETAGKMIAMALPGNTKLDVPENSYLHGLIDSLNSGTIESKSFIADNLTFEPTGKLSDDGTTAVSKLTTVLKAFGTTKLKIEAFTDSSGDPAENKKTSQERANTIKDALVKAGIPADRIDAVGAGSERPIAPNDTEANRAKNRRIELSVVPK
jgi:outer membrane protein OmpA-like peptidoglycan-associated protein